LIGIEYKTCVCCKELFLKGTGHTMMCGCGKIKPLCNVCYQSGIESGEITKTNFTQTDIHKKLMENLR